MFYVYTFTFNTDYLIVAATAKRNEVIKATELLLNALNLGDYDTYTKLCDPHMTSFEPENLGNLIDNMEYRRFCLDQARQLQFHHLQQQQIAHHNQIAMQQQAAASAAAAAAAASAAASASVTFATSANPLQSPAAVPNKQKAGSSQAVSGGGSQSGLVNQVQVQQIASAAAVAAASAALANLNLTSSSQPQPQPQPQTKSSQNSFNSQTAATTPTTTTTTTTTSNNPPFSNATHFNQPIGSSTLTANHGASRQYSLMLNPSVYLLGDEAASIAYTKLSQFINLTSGQINVEQSEETRVWHKKDGNKWLCVHLHRSLVNNNNNNNNAANLLNTAGPQTSASLARLVANQQQLANLAQVHQFNQHLHQQHHQQQHQFLQQQQVPLISLNHSSTGSTSTTTTTNSSRWH